MYDLLLTGGKVVDPAAGYNGTDTRRTAATT
jgi:hypothetical protein